MLGCVKRCRGSRPQRLSELIVLGRTHPHRSPLLVICHIVIRLRQPPVKCQPKLTSNLFDIWCGAAQLRCCQGWIIGLAFAIVGRVKNGLPALICAKRINVVGSAEEWLHCWNLGPRSPQPIGKSRPSAMPIPARFHRPFLSPPLLMISRFRTLSSVKSSLVSSHRIPLRESIAATADRAKLRQRRLTSSPRYRCR